MDKNKDEFLRNEPSDKGNRNDPHSREESGQQPGVSTYSSSDTDGRNQQITKTTSDNYEGEPFGEDADKTFDDVQKD